MLFQTFLEQISIDGLCGDRPLARRDDHLAVGRRHAACGIKSRHARPQACINGYLSVRIDLGTERFGQLGVGDIAAGCKSRIHVQSIVLPECQGAKSSVIVFDGRDSFKSNRDTVLFHPGGVGFSQIRLLPFVAIRTLDEKDSIDRA